MKRVVITGIGSVTPIGCSVNKFWENLLSGKSGIKGLNHLNPSIPSRVGGIVTDFEFSNIENQHIERRISRPVSFALESAYQCMTDSGLSDMTEEENLRFGVCIGTGLGSPGDICQTWDLIKEDKYKKIPPYFITQMIQNMVSSYVSIEYGCKGSVISLNTACATGLHCIGEGFRRIKYGDCSRMLVGGTESAMDEVTFSGFCRMQALSTSFNDNPDISSRPFDSERDGFVIGEGCGILLLEELETAVNRNAKIYGEIVGYGSTGDAFHLTQSSPDGDGQVRAMDLALREAGITDFANEVDYVNAHATSTPLGDEIEYKSISGMINSSESDDCVHISSIKGSIGHLMGASGAVEMVASVMSLHDNFVPPNVNYVSSEFELNDSLKIVNEPLEKNIDCVVCNSFGFGGTNSCVVVRSVKE